jgi:hypothetical protein
MYDKISRQFGDKLRELVYERRGNPHRGLKPFGHRPIPQSLGGDDECLIWFELLDTLEPCGTALACRLDVTADPPEPDYNDTFYVRDLMHLSGEVGWHGCAERKPIESEDSTSGSGSGSGDNNTIYPIVNLGLSCREQLSSSWESSSSYESPSSSSGPESGSESGGGGSGGSGELSSGGGSGEESSGSDISGSGSSGGESSGLSGSGEPSSGGEISGSEGSDGSGGGSGGGESESGSEKDRAIVPSRFSPTGFTALACIESPEVLFIEVMQKDIHQDTLLPIDPKFLDVCEPGTMKAIASADVPAAVGAKVIGGDVSIRLSSYAEPATVTLLLIAKRRGKKFRNWRMPDMTREEYEANERRLDIERYK